MPASLVATARCACSSASCRSSAGRDFLRRRSRAPGRPSCRECSSSAARSTRRAYRLRARPSPTASSAPAPCRSGTPAAPSPAARAACIRPSSPSSCFAYDCSRARYASASAALSMRMLAVEEARDVEIGADVLDDDVGRVAPAADRDVAVRQREAFERRGIGTAHDLDAGAHRRATGRSCRTPLTRSRSVRDLRRQALLPPRSDRRAAIAAPPVAPVSIPREVALSGWSRRRLSAHARRAASARRRRLAAVGADVPLPSTRSRAAAPPPMQAPQWLHVGWA